jgi:hypothetical protein
MGELRTDLRPERAPTPGQLEEYRELIIDTTHEAGKGVRVFADKPGTEFIIPGSMTEWTRPDRKMRTHIEHDRNYAASYKTLSDTARRLLVLETESWLTSGKHNYLTLRNMYRFSWEKDGAVTEAQALKWEIVSRSNVEVELLPYFAKDVLAMEIDRTDDAESAPFRFLEHALVDEVAFDCLLDRTDSFRRDIVATIEAAERLAV